MRRKHSPAYGLNQRPNQKENLGLPLKSLCFAGSLISAIQWLFLNLAALMKAFLIVGHSGSKAMEQKAIQGSD